MAGEQQQLENLWEKVGNELLTKALALLESETVPTAATAETVKILVDAVVSIDELNRRWESGTRSSSGERAFLGRFS